MPAQRTSILLAGAAALVALLVVSGWAPYDRATWLLEVFPVLIALPAMAATYRRFPLTTLLYGLIFVHAVVLMVGGAYTYARVPFGFCLADLFGLERNPYDKIGHVFQGLMPAIAAREILLRGRFVRGAKMPGFLSLCVVMTVSAVYEMIEWVTALAFGEGAYDFLGTQGDLWDTQSDMFFALVGGCAALLLLSRLHDRQLKAFMNRAGEEY